MRKRCAWHSRELDSALLYHRLELIESLRCVGDARGTKHDVEGHTRRLDTLGQHLVEEAKGGVQRARLAAGADELGEGAHVGLRPAVGAKLVPDAKGGVGRAHLGTCVYESVVRDQVGIDTRALHPAETRGRTMGTGVR